MKSSLYLIRCKIVVPSPLFGKSLPPLLRRYSSTISPQGVDMYRCPYHTILRKKLHANSSFEFGDWHLRNNSQVSQLKTREIHWCNFIAAYYQTNREHCQRRDLHRECCLFVHCEFSFRMTLSLVFLFPRTRVEIHKEGHRHEKKKKRSAFRESRPSCPK